GIVSRRDFPVHSPSIAIADIDSDGRADLVLANGTIMAGHGDGTFDTPGPAQVITHTWAVTTADFDGDGRVDAAVTLMDGVAVFRGSPDGNLARRHDFGTMGFPAGLVSGDLDGDGRPDIAVAALGGPSSGGLTALFGEADGSLGRRTDTSIGRVVLSV